MIPCNTTTWPNFRTCNALILLPSPSWLWTSAFPKPCNRLRLRPLELDLLLPNMPKQHLHQDQLPRMVPWRWFLIRIPIAKIKFLVPLLLPLPFLPLSRAVHMARMEQCLPAVPVFLVLVGPSTTKVACILSTTNWRWRPWWVFSTKAPRVPFTPRLLMVIALSRTPMIPQEISCPSMPSGRPTVLALTACWPKLSRPNRAIRAIMLPTPVHSPAHGEVLVIRLVRMRLHSHIPLPIRMYVKDLTILSLPILLLFIQYNLLSFAFAFFHCFCFSFMSLYNHLLLFILNAIPYFRTTIYSHFLLFFSFTLTRSCVGEFLYPLLEFSPEQPHRWTFHQWLLCLWCLQQVLGTWTILPRYDMWHERQRSLSRQCHPRQPMCLGFHYPINSLQKGDIRRRQLKLRFRSSTGLLWYIDRPIVLWYQLQ